MSVLSFDRWWAMVSVLVFAFAAVTMDGLAQEIAPKEIAPNEAAPAPKKDYAQQYYHSFKGDRDISPEFHWHGLDPQDCVEFEPDGLRLTLPLGHPGKRPGTGIGIDTTVKGDFEVTLSYVMLKEPALNDAGNGTGVFLWVDLDKPKLNRGFVSRMTQPDRKFVAWYHLSPPGGEKPVDVLRRFPAKETSGRLRLVRAGNKLSHYVAEGASDGFTFLVEHPFGAEDLKSVRFGGQTGGPDAALEARFLDLRIRADGLPDLPAIALLDAPDRQHARAADAPKTGHGWLAAGLACGVSVLLACAVSLAAVLYWRQRTAAGPTGASGSLIKVKHHGTSS